MVNRKRARARAGAGAAAGMEAWLAKFQFKHGAVQRAKFYERLAGQIRDGKPLDASLRELQSRYQRKRRAMAPILKDWLGALDEGRRFSDAIRPYVADTESIIIAAGEEAGDLSVAFEQAANVARASADILKAVRAEMTGPIIKVIVLVAVLVFVSTSVAPDLARSIPAWAFDDSQRTFFAVTSIVTKTWFLVVPAMVAAGCGIVWSLPRYTGPMRKVLDKIPPWSVYRVYAGSTFMISLAALIRSGVPIEAAIRFIRGKSAPWMRGHLSEMVGRLRSGTEQGEALDVGLLSDDLADSVAIYAKTANFDKSITSVGNEAIRTGIEDIKVKAGIASQLSTILLGLFVGWMFNALMGISDAAQRANSHQEGGTVVSQQHK